MSACTMSVHDLQAKMTVALGSRARVVDVFAQDPARFRLEFTRDHKTKELRWVLFTATRRGCIGKIIFTLEKDATAHVKSIVVNPEWRGYGLARILYHACLATLHELNIAELHLEAEEDTKRHGKLVHVYETWGFCTKPDAKILFLYNDTQCFRKVPMQLPLASRAFVPIEPTPTNKRTWFCMLTLQTLDGTCLVASEDGAIQTAKPGARRAESLWQTLVGADNTIALRSVHGKFLCAEENGAILADRRLKSTWETFHVVPHRVARAADDADAQQQENELKSSVATGGGIALRNFHGTYLCIDATAQRVVSSSEPVAWDGGDMMALVCSGGTTAAAGDKTAAPLSVKILRKYQTQAFVQAQVARFGRCDHATLSIADACALVVSLTSDGGKRTNNKAAMRDSFVLRYMLASAEAMRDDGHPDWLQLAFFLRALGMLFLGWITDDDDDAAAAALRSISAREWLEEVSTWVVGSAIPSSVGYSELNALNSDHCNSAKQSDVPTQGAGMDSVVLPWTPDAYLYHVLTRNDTSLPTEALQTLRFYALSAWHTHDCYDELCAPQDADTKDWLRSLELPRRVSDAALQRVDVDRVMPYYLSLADKYLPQVLQW